MPPKHLYFDRALDSWVLSRHADVAAALKEPRLMQISQRASLEKIAVRRDVIQILSQKEAAVIARRMREGLDQRFETISPVSAIDLLEAVLMPWTLAMAMQVINAHPFVKRRLMRIAPLVSGSLLERPRTEVTPLAKKWRALRRKLADLEQNHFLLRNAPGSRSTLIGISQTLPSFLLSIAAALIVHPDAAKTLRNKPHLVPKAVEELLRFAGPVHTLHRVAVKRVIIAGAPICAGEKLRLMIDSANHDPEMFSDPERIDFSRANVTHLAFGIGPHFCVGSQLVRMAASIMIERMFVAGECPSLVRPVSWKRGGTLCSVENLLVTGLSRSE